MDASRFDIKNHLRELSLYEVGESTVPGFNKIINLASNECAVSPSDHVLTAIQSSLPQLNRYANNSSSVLIEKLANTHNLPKDNLICGDGSAELILLLTEAFLNPGDEVLTWKHGYVLYETAAKRMGAKCIKVESKNFIDPQALLDSVTPLTKLVFLDNPNNPTGSYANLNELKFIRNNLRADILLVIDAAYAEYVFADNYESGINLVKEFDNVCMLRTFSKVYGLAGLRLGWMCAHQDIIRTIRTIQQPAPVNALAQCAGMAALDEPNRIDFIKEQNFSVRSGLIKKLKALELIVYPSETNFILIDFGSSDVANRIFNSLKSCGIIVRPMRAYRLDSCLRITIGTAEEMLVFTESLEKLMVDSLTPATASEI